MRRPFLCFALATLGWLPARAVQAQAEAPAMTAGEIPSASPVAEQSALTVESLQAELQEMQARHRQQIEGLRADLARQEEEAASEHEREAMQREHLLRIYGFADVGAMRTIAPEEPMMASQFTTPLTFYLGRLNLYYDVRPDPDFRFLAETRLSLYPSGTSQVSNTGQITRTSTLVSDVSSPNPTASVSWGSIILERAVLDWTRYPFLSVRAGFFLTPFGIFNVDHGSPTLVTVSLPIYIGQGWIPERQLGLQIFGSHPVQRWELGYTATVSNGRSDGVLDLGDSKAFGGRLFARRQGQLGLLIGASALYQPYRRNREQFGPGADGGITYSNTRVVERTMLTLGNDISIDYRGLRVRSELVYFQTEYTPGLREAALQDAPPQGRGGLAPDSRQFNWSIIVAYRWWKLEPYLRSEVFMTSPSQGLITRVWSPGAGLNLYIRPSVILKASWTQPRFYADDDPEDLASQQNFHSFVGLLTWAF
ncbi:MAG: hypothetical protein JXP73_05320 [Deltaproteobacteria bacterium]|nr:hypothetical protein [Deltaproteobacteria bacterium]